MIRPLRQHRRNPVATALWANALLLAGILGALLVGQSRSSLLPAAWGQPPVAATSGSVSIMPAQFSGNNWGCYLLDSDAQTIVAYQYNPGDKALRLVAARSYKYDHRLENFNTFPSPREVQHLVDLQDNARGAMTPTTQDHD